MTSMKRISVIVPVYKVEEYLDRCVSSIVNQTYRDLEIILVDDGSPDQCSAMCDIWAQKDNRIRVIHKENGGVSSARNAGLRIAKGEWISFIDSDDWIHPQFFEILYMQTLKYPIADVLALSMEKVTELCPYKEIDLDVPCFSAVSIQDIFKNRTIRNYVWGKIYRAKAIKDRLFDIRLSIGEDSLFNAQLFLELTVNVYYCGEKLYFYFQREPSAVHQMEPRQMEVLRKAYHDLARNEKRSLPKSIYLIEAIKRAMSIRYGEQVVTTSKESRKRINTMIFSDLKELNDLNSISYKERFIYTLFYYSPLFYRLFRIVNDPTLLIWEKEQRKKREDKKPT